MENSLNVILFIINILPIFLLMSSIVISPSRRMFRGLPIMVFLKSILYNIIIFSLVLCIVMLFIEPSLGLLIVLLIVLEYKFFPLVVGLYLLISAGTNLIWFKRYWYIIILLLAICMIWFVLNVSHFGT